MVCGMREEALTWGTVSSVGCIKVLVEVGLVQGLLAGLAGGACWGGYSKLVGLWGYWRQGNYLAMVCGVRQD